MTSMASLRHELPCLALVLNFVAPSKRGMLADVLLLWLECRRASRASDGMLAAIRLAWWRDALRQAAKTGDTQHTPLVARLTQHHQQATLALPKIARIIDGMVAKRLAEEAVAKALLTWHNAIGDYLGEGGSQALAVLDKALLGEAYNKGDTAQPKSAALAVHIRVIYWLVADPTRLAYPTQRPWLAAELAWLLLWRRI